MSDMNGIHFMMPTPFDDNGQIDEASIQSLVGMAIKAECSGIVCLGVTGEAARLTDAERALVSERVIGEAKQHLIVTVGTSATGTDMAVQRSVEAASMGASAVMVAPAPVAKQNLDAVFSYYKSVASSVRIPVVAQDFPKESNVFMPASFMGRLNTEIEGIEYLKLEDPPTPPKITAIKDLLGDSLRIFGGLGGVFFYEELARGACGAMTGFAFPEILVTIYSHFADGMHDKARGVFYRYLPLIRYEAQEGIGLSLRKEVLKRRGVLRSAKIRHPAANIDNVTREELYRLLDVLEIA